MKKEIQTGLFTSFETEFVSKGKFKKVPKDNPSFPSLRLRYERSDAKQSEALARSLPGNDLELLKSLLARGTFGECAELITRLRSIEDAMLQIEVLLQEARFEYLRGEWMKSSQICDLIERYPDLPALTRMVMLQIRSNAYFEQGRFEESLSDFRKLESFESLFPHGQVPLYAHTNRVRLEARIYGLEKGRKETHKLWNQTMLKIQTKNLDPVLTMLRSQIDLKRLSSQDYSREAMGCYRISKAMGDELYAALALFDLCLTQKALSHDLMAEFKQACMMHPRVKKLHEEVFELGEPGFQTAKDMKHYWNQRTDLGKNVDTQNLETYSVIFMPELGLRVDLIAAKQEQCELQPRTMAILNLLKQGPIAKSDLFKKIWGLNFSMEKHDSVIRTAISRAREQSGLVIECEGREVSLHPSVLFIYM
jgi:tetratricopeptide (TPR) repeat protein